MYKVYYDHKCYKIAKIKEFLIWWSWYKKDMIILNFLNFCTLYFLKKKVFDLLGCIHIDIIKHYKWYTYIVKEDLILLKKTLYF